MEQEIWKSIKGYENYEVSNLGRIKSLKYGKEKILKPVKNKYGYLQVVLCGDGKIKNFKIHQLVASAFIPNPLGFTEINHKDENKINNVVSNIEWVSRSYNIHYGTRTKRAAAALSKPVEASRFSDFREICLRFSSTMEAERNGYGHQNVSACCRGCFHREGNNKYRGLFWRFAS